MHIITQKHTHTQTSTNTHISPLHPHFWNDPLCERRAVFAGTKEKCSYRFLENILLHNTCDWRCWTVQVKVKRVDPKSSHLMERSIFLFPFFLYLCGVTYVNGAYCGNYCTTHVSQTIILHSLKLGGAGSVASQWHSGRGDTISETSGKSLFRKCYMPLAWGVPKNTAKNPECSGLLYCWSKTLTTATFLNRPSFFPSCLLYPGHSRGCGAVDGGHTDCETLRA